MPSILDSGIAKSFNSFAANTFSVGQVELSAEHEKSEIEPLKEQSLWKSVILQAILDATSAAVNKKSRTYKTQAIIWLSTTNKDFLFVCEMAGLEPKYVIKNAKSAIKRSTITNRRKQHRKRMINSIKDKKLINYNESASGINSRYAI